MLALLRRILSALLRGTAGVAPLIGPGPLLPPHPDDGTGPDGQDRPDQPRERS